ncbi:MAG: AraC family transcriptional regulator [Cyclobacteriaceae bacterium]|nr:MAG: AraC family transcriptional regulator [Cyclobacteriaceae bacterium]
MTDKKNPIPFYTLETLRTARPATADSDIDVFRFEYLAKDLAHLRAPHRHMFYTFILVARGSGEHDIDFEAYPLKPRRLFLISPGQVHTWNTVRNVSGYVVLFTDNLFSSVGGPYPVQIRTLFKPGQPQYYDLSDVELKKWIELCNNMESELLSADALSKQAFFHQLGLMLVWAARLSRYTHNPLPIDILSTFQNLIEEHFQTKHTTSEYASMLNVSASYLNALVKRKTGKSAGELIRQRILLEARRHLAHSGLTVGEIAFHLGFADNSYFGRFFKKYTGVTPAAFRKSTFAR